MVYGKINIFKTLILCLIVLFCSVVTFGNKNKIETNLLKVIFPTDIIESTNLIDIANKSTSIVRIVFESSDIDSLDNLKDEFNNSINSEYFDSSNIDSNSILNIYKENSSNFLSRKTREYLKTKKYSTVKENALMELYNPINIQIVDFDKDPYYLLTDFFKSQNIKSSNPILLNNKYYDYEIITIKNDSLNQNEINKGVAELIEIQKKLSVKNKSNVYLAGAPIHSFVTNKSASLSINLICLLSTLFILALTFMFFRNLKNILPISLSILLGFWMGFCATKLMFPSFHITTLLFATTLIGIGIDYSYHYIFNNCTLDKSFIKSLTFSMLSTVIAFLLLYISGIELLKQISIFTIFGLITIYFVVLLFYPQLKFSAPKLAMKLSVNNKFRYITCAVLIILSLFGCFKIRINDSLTALYEPTKTLKLAESLYERVSNQPGSKLTVIETKGEDLETAIENEELVGEYLDTKNIDYFSLSSLVPSSSRQEENIRLVKGLYNNDLDSFSDYLSKTQIENLKNRSAKPISIDVSKNKYLSPFIINSNTIMMFVNLNKDNVIDLTNYSNSMLIDVAAECEKYLKSYRLSISKVLPLIFLVLFISLGLLYGFRNSIKMILPPLIGGISSILLASSFGLTINLFSFIAIFLILGFTIDYSIFRVSGVKTSEDAIFISFITTSFSFLALSFTSFKFVSSISLIIFLGILISYIVGLILHSEDTEQI